MSDLMALSTPDLQHPSQEENNMQTQCFLPSSMSGDVTVLLLYGELLRLLLIAGCFLCFNKASITFLKHANLFLQSFYLFIS